MKKTLLIISSLLVVITGSKAQITISSNDITIPTHLVYQAIDSVHTGISVGSAGANQTWNMSTLAQSSKDTLTFESYAWAPNANFPNANLVIKQGWSAQYQYAVNSSSSLSFPGSAGILNLFGYPTQVTQTSTPAEIFVPYPYTYNSSFSNNYKSFAKFYYGHDPGVGIVLDSVRDRITYKKSGVVDAWGSLTTPLGTFNVIRSKETKVKHDTIDVYYVIGLGAWHNDAQDSMDSTTTYTYWANGIGFPLASATMDSTGAVKSVQWLTTLPALGVSEYTALSNETVYPNPAQNEINFVADASKQKAIQLFDVTGRLIDTYSVLDEKTTINTSNFANGVYFYSIIGKDNSILTRGKFAITK